MTLPDFAYEKKIQKRGFKLIGGVDEVGRGCFAGPVVAGCVVIKETSEEIIINDSKKLSPKQREIADKWIRKNAVAFGIGQASVAQINKFGIKKATEIAFRKAIAKVKPDYLLIDAFYIPFVRGLRRKNQKAIIKGDSLSISIAAASIIAKVYRDKLMTRLAHNPKYRKYKWDKNKGYGTKEHREMIQKYGLNRHFRNFSFSQSQ